jgi:hypothetical protein
MSESNFEQILRTRINAQTAYEQGVATNRRQAQIEKDRLASLKQQRLEALQPTVAQVISNDIAGFVDVMNQNDVQPPHELVTQIKSIERKRIGRRKKHPVVRDVVTEETIPVWVLTRESMLDTETYRNVGIGMVKEQHLLKSKGIAVDQEKNIYPYTSQLLVSAFAEDGDGHRYSQEEWTNNSDFSNIGVILNSDRRVTAEDLAPADQLLLHDGELSDHDQPRVSLLRDRMLSLATGRAEF